MVELVFMACLVVRPEACIEHRLGFLARPNPVTCIMQAPQQLAAWAATHPDYKITAWRCEDPERRKTDA